MNPGTIIDNVARVTTRLGELIGQENELLHQRRPQELSQSQAEKEQLAGQYERDMALLRANPAMLRRATRDQIDKLRKATTVFQDILEDHRRLVQTTKSVTDRMVKAITEEVAQKRQPVAGYNAKALMIPAFARPDRPVSLALNQVV